MSKDRVLILTFILIVSLSPFFGIMFVGILENGDASIIFHPMSLMIGYVFTLIPTTISGFFVCLYANYLSQKIDSSYTQWYWLVNLTSVCMLCSLIFPVSMGVFGTLFWKAPLDVIFLPWLAPSLAAGLVMGVILSPLWYSHTKRF